MIFASPELSSLQTVNMVSNLVLVLPDNIQWCSGSGATGAIAPVPIFQGRAPLQFLFLLLLVHFAYILKKLAFDFNYYW